MPNCGSYKSANAARPAQNYALKGPRLLPAIHHLLERMPPAEQRKLLHLNLHLPHSHHTPEPPSGVAPPHPA